MRQQEPGFSGLLGPTELIQQRGLLRPTELVKQAAGDLVTTHGPRVVLS